MSDFNFQATGEMLRRRAMATSSGAGIPGQSGGAPTTIASPVEQQGMNRMGNTGAPAMPARPTLSGGQAPAHPLSAQVQGLDQAKMEQAGFITKALIKQLDKLTPGQDVNTI